MPIINLPVQSGSNKILKSMNRKHTIERYIKLINKLKKANPLIKFSSDFIIAYPNETEEDFNDTLKLMKKLNLLILIHSFLVQGLELLQSLKIKDDIAKISFVSKIADEIKLKYEKLYLIKSQSPF